jgi:hypothetical protein
VEYSQIIKAKVAAATFKATKEEKYNIKEI